MPEEKYEFLHKVIAEEKELDISIDRVDKLESPLLVIGLGGTGSEAVHVIKSTFAKRYNLPVDANGNAIPVPRNTAYLVIDSDTSSQGSLATHEFRNISVPGLEAILNPKNRQTMPWENEWLNKYLDTTSVAAGAGTYRQSARLMLSRNFNAVFSTINSKLQEICTVAQGVGGNTGLVNIVIISGISGGTGSGTFLDIAQIVRSIMSRDAMLNNLKYRVSAYLIMPDVSCSVVPAAHPLQAVFKSNAYAALKELDFWMGYESSHKTLYTMKYSADDASRITWVRPFDACSLMSGTTYAGSPYNEPKKVVFNTIAENLLHYLANENNGLDANGNPKHTYISYEDNLSAAVDALTKEYPVNHRYRAIGAYTKKIPKKKILYYEGSRLFSTFMPGRNEHGIILPVAKLVDRGVCRADVINVCGDLEGHYRRFKDVVRLPAFCNIEPEDANAIDSLRNAKPEPHFQTDIGNHPWRSSVLAPGARQSAEQYLDIAWRNFVAFAGNVISDPEFGPFALLEYLTKGENTLRQSLSELLNYWVTSESNFRGTLTNLEQSCKNTWGAFTNPPLFGRRAAVENYMQNLIKYYDGIRRAEFAGAYAKALEKFSKRVDEYRDQALRQLCKALDQMDKDFSDNDAEWDDTSSELFSLDAVKASLDNSFTTNNANQRITREFLSMLCEASFVTERNPDVHSSGVAFPFGSVSMSSIRNSLREKLEQCFGGVNDASMDEILIDQVGTDVALRNQEMDKLARSIMSSASPMFSKDPATGNTPHAEFAYLSVPDNAPGYLAHYKNTLVNVEPKSSSLRDHIFCLNTYDGMPMYMYSQMLDLEAAYTARLPMSSQSKGMHLVWDGNLDSDVITNWSKLPSPRPFYFFGTSGSEADKLDFENAQTLVDKAIACGMLSINDTLPIPSYTLRIKYTEGGLAAPKTSELIRQDIAQIDQMIDPITNTPLTAVQKLQPLLDYQATGTVTSVTETAKPMCMQKYLGLVGQPCDPFQDGIAANPTTLATARKNHKLLCRALIAAMLCADPVTRLSVEKQLEGMEYVQSRISQINNVVNAWEPRISYAETAAKMIVYGLITINMGTIGYKLDGITSALIQQQLLKDELRNADDYTKCTGYMADMAQDNPVRHQLEFELNQLEAELQTQALANTMPQERKEVFYANAKRLQEGVQEEYNALRTAERGIGADLHLIGNKKSVLEGILRFANTAERNYRP